MIYLAFQIYTYLNSKNIIAMKNSDEIRIKEFQKISEVLELILNNIKELNLSYSGMQPKPKKNLREGWISEKKARFTLEIPKKTLQELIDAGELPYTRLGEYYFFKEADIKLLLENKYISLEKK